MADDHGSYRMYWVRGDEVPPDELLPEIEQPNGWVRRTIHPDGADEALVVEHDPRQVSVFTAHGSDVRDSSRRFLEQNGYRSAYRSEKVELWVAETRDLHARLDYLSQGSAQVAMPGLDLT